MNIALFKDTIGGLISNAIRFWEMARIPFNMLLVTLVLFIISPARLLQLSEESLLVFVALGIVANILFSAAYIIDLILQASDLEKAYIYLARFAIWITGTCFALILTYFTITSINWI